MTILNEGYAYIWEYRVRSDAVEQFREYYGPSGRWVQLFRRAPGYSGTSLYQDVADNERYVTVDRWESEESFRDFREKFAAEFEELDEFCESLTASETRVGRFARVIK